MSVLVTRPQPGAAETARRLLALGRTPVLAPVLEIVPLAADLPPPDGIQAVLITSANALAALEAGMPSSAGIALGLDRLVMLASGASRIDQVVWSSMS